MQLNRRTQTPAMPSVDDPATQDKTVPARPRVAEGKTPTTFHLWDETRYALHTAQWELGMNLSEIGKRPSGNTWRVRV